MRKILKKLFLTKEERRILSMYFLFPNEKVKTVETDTRVDEKSYTFLHSGTGREQYDAKYGLTRELADKLLPYVTYTEYKDGDEWVLKVSLKVVDE